MISSCCHGIRPTRLCLPSSLAGLAITLASLGLSVTA